MKITPEEAHIIRHALGQDSGGKEPYRNYYVCRPDSPDHGTVEGLVDRGLMEHRTDSLGVQDTTDLYHVTEAGRAAVVG